MIESKDVYLNHLDLINLEPFALGQGSDAKVYKVNNNILYKIYHLPKNEVTIDLLDKDVKIVDSLKNIKINNVVLPLLDYLDEDGVRVSRQDAIYKAIKKQEKVKLTSLPIGSIYVNNHFRGCVLKNHSHSFPIHYINVFPLKVKLKIIRELIDEIEELLNNNIYHIDLANKPIFDKERKSHSNVLVKLNLHPEIIDLDGISAVYREIKDDYYYQKCLFGLKNLIIEILCDLDLDNIELLDLEYLKHIFKNDELKLGLINTLEDENSDIKTLKRMLMK